MVASAALAQAVQQCAAAPATLAPAAWWVWRLLHECLSSAHGEWGSPGGWLPCGRVQPLPLPDKMPVQNISLYKGFLRNYGVCVKEMYETAWSLGHTHSEADLL